MGLICCSTMKYLGLGLQGTLWALNLAETLKDDAPDGAPERTL